VFVRELDAGSTEMAHLQPDGGNTQNFSKTGSISGDGSLVTQILTCSSRTVSNRSRESLRNLGNR
jgi:hypothetical protein